MNGRWRISVKRENCTNFKKLKINKLHLYVLGVLNFMVDLLISSNTNNVSIVVCKNVKLVTLKKIFKNKKECISSTLQVAFKIFL